MEFVQLLQSQGISRLVFDLAGGVYRLLGFRGTCRLARQLLPPPKHFGDEEDMLIAAARTGDIATGAFAIEKGACKYFSMVCTAVEGGHVAFFKKLCFPVLGEFKDSAPVIISDSANGGVEMFSCCLEAFGCINPMIDLMWTLYITGMSTQFCLNDVAPRTVGVLIDKYVEENGTNEYLTLVEKIMDAWMYGYTGDAAYKKAALIGEDDYPSWFWERVLFGALTSMNLEIVAEVLPHVHLQKQSVIHAVVLRNSVPLCWLLFKHGGVVHDDVEIIKKRAKHAGSIDVYDFVTAMEARDTIDPERLKSDELCTVVEDFFLEDEEFERSGRLWPSSNCRLMEFVDRGDYNRVKRMLSDGGNPLNVFLRPFLNGLFNTAILKHVAACYPECIELNHDELPTLDAEFESSIPNYEGVKYVKKLRKIYAEIIDRQKN